MDWKNIEGHLVDLFFAALGAALISGISVFFQYLGAHFSDLQIFSGQVGGAFAAIKFLNRTC